MSYAYTALGLPFSLICPSKPPSGPHKDKGKGVHLMVGLGVFVGKVCVKQARGVMGGHRPKQQTVNLVSHRHTSLRCFCG
jgi:hypothetical protein